MAITISSSMVKGASTPSPFSLKTKDLGLGVSSGFFDSINPISLSAASKSRLPRGVERLPASKVAVRYYTEGDLYLFDEFQTARPPNSRRPKIENLYDVFVNIRDDEAEHYKTMKACQTHGSLRSPHSFPDEAWEEDSGCILPQADCEGIVDCINKSIRDPPGNKK
ncbi:hypothetical protein RD792_002697 [Penstemon davidsonii]|uniref:Uncharacterized protein n=1 Tax=Penstemon davidsonii TaxID=160366 RepID=A0ABR0DRV1_9LAMI|nr:hypothetical protein RD792_002697 [Penstemon davidsonii]